MRTTKLQWVHISSELPSSKEFGPYPTVVAALSCSGEPKFGFRVRDAQLRFFGGDKNRHYWVDPVTIKPIENDSWFVEYWAPPFEPPKG